MVKNCRNIGSTEKFKLYCDRRSVGQFALVSGPRSAGHLRSCCFGAPSLTRGRACNLLIHFAVTLGFKSCRTRDLVLLSHLSLPQSGGPGPHIYIPQEQGAQLYPWSLG
jgi:hypothetical protein